ncbi:hypothetical protein Scep_008738 [Stephania cephalantha]|uniref:Uncharacterized protein n=1 Tax=Stephania cephalantha TaxID=152367 RepID=A0AAP0PCG2_9MAGN
MDRLLARSTQHNHQLKLFVLCLLPFEFSSLEVAKMPRVKKLLKDIDPNTVNWYADVYVLEKLPIKQSNTSSVRQQRLILVDEEGYQIQATIFGNDINLFESRLQTKVAYRISNAFVKEIEARYRLVPSPHQWSISRNTLIKKVPDSETFPLIEEVKFVTLDEIDEYLDIDEYIDVAVLALIAKPKRDVTKRNGQPASLQEFIVIDECCMPIRLTLWDEFATRIGPSVEERIAKTPVLVCRRLKVAYHSGICLATRSSSTIDLVNDSERAQTLRQWFNRNCTVIEDLINNDGMSIPIHFREVFYCTNCNHEDAHGTPRARIEVELTDESGALKVVAYGSIAEDIISLNAQEIMTKTIAGEACNVIDASKLLKSASFFYVYVQADKLVDNTITRFFLVGISPINVKVGNLDLNGDKGNIDGALVANAQTSVCGSARLKETNGEVIVETGEVILHTVASATSSSKRETSNFTSRSSKLLKPAVVSLESASTSSG